MTDKVHGHTLFCDDIRMEIGNKASLMGIYSGGMNIAAEFPFSLPKLAFWLRYEEPFNAHWDFLHIKVYFPGNEEPILNIDYPLKEARTNAPPPAKLDTPHDLERMRAFYIPFLVGPVVIPEEGWIRVRGHYDSEILKMGALAVTKATA
jgi:hypothetical protein